MSRKTCFFLGCWLAACCPMIANALSIQGYESENHGPHAFSARLWLAPQDANRYENVRVFLVSGAHRQLIHSSLTQVNHRPVIHLSADKPLVDPVHFLISYQDQGKRKLLSYTPVSMVGSTSPTVPEHVVGKVHQSVVQTPAPLVTEPQPVTHDVRGTRIYLNRDTSIYDIARRFPLDPISSTRMAAYLHVFNAGSRFANQSGLLSARQYFYIPTVNELVDLDHTLWQSYRRLLLNTIHTQTTAHRTVSPVHKVIRTVHPVSPAVQLKRNHVSVERAVLASDVSASARHGTEDQISESVAKEKMQQDISALDNKISRLMTEVSRREQALKEQDKTMTATPAAAVSLLHSQAHSSVMPSSSVVQQAASGQMRESPLHTQPEIAESHQHMDADVEEGKAESSLLLWHWWPLGLIIILLVLIYVGYRVFLARRQRDEKNRLDLALSEEMRTEIKTRVREDLSSEVQTTPAEPTDVLVDIKKEDLLLQKSETVADFLKAAEKRLSRSEDAAAERLLIGAITKMPTESPLYLKLLHIYFKNGLQEPAYQVIDTVFALTKGQGSDWKSLLHMSKRYKIRYPEDLMQQAETPEKASPEKVSS